MKTLELEFQKGGATFTQLKREGNLVLYQAKRNASGGRWWEVAFVGSHNGYTIGGNDVGAAETYPSNEEVGKKAWACVSQERAEEKFEEIKRGKVQGKTTPQVYIPKPLGNKKGRQPILKPCICCGKEIYSSIFRYGKGKCGECLEKFPNPRPKRGRPKL